MQSFSNSRIAQQSTCCHRQSFRRERAYISRDVSRNSCHCIKRDPSQRKLHHQRLSCQASQSDGPPAPPSDGSGGEGGGGGDDDAGQPGGSEPDKSWGRGALNWLMAKNTDFGLGLRYGIGVGVAVLLGLLYSERADQQSNELAAEPGALPANSQDQVGQPQSLSDR